MEALIAKIIAIAPEIFSTIAIVLSSVVVIATAVARITPSKSDDEKVSKIKAFVDKILPYLPTIGVNPQAKDLKEKAENK